MLTWRTGNWSSYPSDGRAFLERGGPKDLWYVFETDPDGVLLAGFPKLREEPFNTLPEAQKWVEENVPAPAPKEVA